MLCPGSNWLAASLNAFAMRGKVAMDISIVTSHMEVFDPTTKRQAWYEPKW